MRPSLPSGLTVALLLGLGLAACNADENASVPPPDEPAQTGSIPMDPATDPAIDPAAPAAAPTEEPAPLEPAPLPDEPAPQ